MPQQGVLLQFQGIGQDMFAGGLVSSHSGNLSIRRADRLIITRRGSMLGHLTARDLVETGVEEDDEPSPLASTELPTHRAIYRKNPASAIVHAHGPYAMALSLVEDEITPLDMEGVHLLPKVPVIVAKATLKAEERAGIVSEALRQHRIVLLRGQGSFAAARTLEEAYHWTSALEVSCQILWLLKALGDTSRKGILQM